MNKKKNRERTVDDKKKRGGRSGIDVISVHVYFGTTSAARPGAPLHIYVHLAECIYTAIREPIIMVANLQRSEIVRDSFIFYLGNAFFHKTGTVFVMGDESISTICVCASIVAIPCTTRFLIT